MKFTTIQTLLRWCNEIYNNTNFAHENFTTIQTLARV